MHGVFIIKKSKKTTAPVEVSKGNGAVVKKSH
jgi:hypothetical protein